jgi:hypothetical protein
MLLTQTCELQKDCKGLINVGEEPYVAATLGCTMGIMSHPLLRGSVIRMLPDSFQNGISVEPTLKSEFHSFDHYVRALRWQRLAPAFSFRTGETVCSQNELEDSRTYTREPYPYDRNDLAGKTVRQSAPAIVARIAELPEVRAAEGETGEILPFVAASCNRETGAYTVAALPRTIDGLMNCTTPPAHVTCRGLSAEKPFAAFGHFASLTLVFDRPLSGARLYGGDLLLSDHGDITDLPGVTLDGNRLVLAGELLDRLGSEGASFDDLADPGSVFKLIW